LLAPIDAAIFLGTLMHLTLFALMVSPKYFLCISGNFELVLAGLTQDDLS